MAIRSIHETITLTGIIIDVASMFALEMIFGGSLMDRADCHGVAVLLLKIACHWALGFANTRVEVSLGISWCIFGMFCIQEKTFLIMNMRWIAIAITPSGTFGIFFTRFNTILLRHGLGSVGDVRSPVARCLHFSQWIA